MNSDTIGEFFEKHGRMFLATNESGARRLIIDGELHALLGQQSDFDQLTILGPLLFFYYLLCRNQFGGDEEGFEVGLLGPVVGTAASGLGTIGSYVFVGAGTAALGVGSSVIGTVYTYVIPPTVSMVKTGATEAANLITTGAIGAAKGVISGVMKTQEVVVNIASGAIEKTGVVSASTSSMVAGFAMNKMRGRAMEFMAAKLGNEMTLAITGSGAATTMLEAVSAMVTVKVGVGLLAVGGTIGGGVWVYSLTINANCGVFPHNCVVDDFNAPISYDEVCVEQMNKVCGYFESMTIDEDVKNACTAAIDFVSDHVDGNIPRFTSRLVDYFTHAENQKNANKIFEYYNKNHLEFCPAYADSNVFVKYLVSQNKNVAHFMWGGVVGLKNQLYDLATWTANQALECTRWMFWKIMGVLYYIVSNPAGVGVGWMLALFMIAYSLADTLVKEVIRVPGKLSTRLIGGGGQSGGGVRGQGATYNMSKTEIINTINNVNVPPPLPPTPPVQIIQTPPKVVVIPRAFLLDRSKFIYGTNELPRYEHACKLLKGLILGEIVLTREEYDFISFVVNHITSYHKPALSQKEYDLLVVLDRANSLGKFRLTEDKSSIVTERYTHWGNKKKEWKTYNTVNDMPY